MRVARENDSTQEESNESRVEEHTQKIDVEHSTNEEKGKKKRTNKS